MRIAMIAPPFVAVPPPRYGGTELVVAGLVDGLVALGHAVTLYAAGDSTSGSTLRAHYAQAVWPPNPTRELVHAATSVWDILERREVDLVHVHCPAALAFAPLVPLPMIYTVHHARDEAICELIESVKRAQLTTVAISYRQRALLGCGEATVIHHGLPPARYAFGAGAGGYAVFLGCGLTQSLICSIKQSGLPMLRIVFLGCGLNQSLSNKHCVFVLLF